MTANEPDPLRREVHLTYSGSAALPAVRPGAPPSGVVAKLERASRHLQELCAEVTAVAQGTRIEVNIADNAASGYREWTMRLIDAPPPPLSISLAAGDVVHNLRAALDHLMWQLVLANHRTPTNQTTFPIASSRKSYGDVRAQRAAGASAEALRRLDALEPYKDGAGATLYELHELDIADKHRLLLTTVAASSTFIVDFRRSLQALVAPRIPLQLDDMPAMELPLKYADPVPVEDGAVVLRGPLGNTSQDDTRFQFHIVLQRDDAISNVPLAEMLVTFQTAVHDTYQTFADLLV